MIVGAGAVGLEYQYRDRNWERGVFLAGIGVGKGDVLMSYEVSLFVLCHCGMLGLGCLCLEDSLLLFAGFGLRGSVVPWYVNHRLTGE